MSEEKTIECVKCGKKKKENEGHYMLGGTTFCCEKCCGDKEKGEHNEKSENVCEYC